MPFGRPRRSPEESGASIVGYAQMSAAKSRAIPANPVREAELAREREFSERFFFAGGSDAVVGSFEREAPALGWDAIRGEPFWELRSGNDEGGALRHRMRLSRDSLHTRLRAVAIGSSARDLSLLSAADQALVLPRRGVEFDPVLRARLPKGIPGERGGLWWVWNSSSAESARRGLSSL